MRKIVSMLLVLVVVFSMANLTVFAADTSVLVDVTNQAVTEKEHFEFTWTIESAGTLTVEASGNPAYRYTILYPDGLASIPQKTNKNWELKQAGTYTIQIGAYDNANYSYTSGTVGLKLCFTPNEGSAETPIEKKTYQISDTRLKLGSNSVELLETAVTTIYAFEPAEAGVYTFTVPAGMIIGLWGAGSWFLSDPGSTSNGLEWTCTSVGQSAYVGVSGAQSQVALMVEKTAEGQGNEQAAYVTYENSHTFPNGFLNLTGSEELESVNVNEAHMAVLGTDDYYHLDTEQGPVLYVDLNTEEYVLAHAYGAGDGPAANVLRGEVNGIKYDFLTAMKAYSTFDLYPLTIDLMNFIQGFGTYQGWFNPVYSSFAAIKEAENLNADTAWMVLCRYIPACQHPAYTYTNNGDGTHTATCGTCGNSVTEDHDYANVTDATKSVKCAHCDSMSVGCYSAGLDMGNSLAFNMFVPVSSVLGTTYAQGTGNYIIIEKTNDKGEVTEYRYEQSDDSQWQKTNQYINLVSFNKIVAREMTDTFKITMYNAAGHKISATFENSIANMLLTALNGEGDANSKSLYVDLLNYGTEAQKKLNYKLDDLANAGVTAEQQETYASPEQVQENLQTVTGAPYYQVGADMSSKLTMTVFYVTSQVPTATSARISFTNHRGQEKVTEINELPTINNGIAIMLVVDQMVIADCEELITIELLDAEGNAVSTLVDSLGSAVARDTTGDELFKAIMKLSYSARVYFGTEKD